MQCSAMELCTAKYYSISYNAILGSILQYHTIPHHTVQCNRIDHNTARYNTTTQYKTMQTHGSAQHNTTCQTQYTRRDATQYNIIFTVRCRILKLNTTGCYTVPYSTPQYNSMQYNNIQYTATY